MFQFIFYSALVALGLWCWDITYDYLFDKIILGSAIIGNAICAALALWALLQ